MDQDKPGMAYRNSAVVGVRILNDETVSEYLLANQEFLIRWLSEHTTKEIVELFAKKLRDKDFVYGPTPSLADGTGSPMGVSESVKNSITSQIFKRYLHGEKIARKTASKKDWSSLQRMSEEDLFMELIRDIASELDVNLLCHKILRNVSILTNSDRSSLFLVRGSRDSKHLVSKLFDVTETSTLEEVIHTELNEIKVPFGKGVVGIVAQTGKTINIPDAYEDPRFNQEIDRQTGFRTNSLLSMPIVNYEGEVVGVAQIINKSTGSHFTQQDEDLFRKYLIFCGIGLTNAQLFEMSVQEFKRNQLLLHLARGIFEEQTNLEKLVQKVMLDAQDLLKCEKCSVYLLEDTCERDISRFTQSFLSRLGSYARKSLALTMQDPAITQKPGPTPKAHIFRTPEEVVFSKAFDLAAKDGAVTVPGEKELAMSKTAHIAKFVVTSGLPVNVADLETDGRFGQGPFKDKDGKPLKTVLCMPIHNSEKKIIGVTQLINKINGQPFNDNDVNIIEAFSIFTGLGIHNCQMYENACQLMAKQSVALEVLSFHATASTAETKSLKVAKIPEAETLHLYDFDFNDGALDDDGTLQACVRMFMDSNAINTFKIPYDVLCRFLCTVKKNYRPVTYHNWRHAFNVCQTMFTIIYSGELKPLFEPLEIFCLLTACLCHDLDHRGTNNAFQTKVASPLAMLYSTSVLEHHHFDHCIMILNSEGNNIFQSLPPEQYRRAIKFIEHAILSTDLALYFKKRGDFKKLVEAGEKSFVDPNKRALLRAMMMTACDVAAITKPWDVQQQVAQLVMSEFFEQGDIERNQLGEQPIPMMDRNKKDELPKMQLGFIDAICTPVYKLFALINDKLSPLYNGCDGNRRRWQDLADKHEARLGHSNDSSATAVQSDSKPQEEGRRRVAGAPQAVSGAHDAEQGVQSQQALQPVVVAQQRAASNNGSRHRQTQTDQHQSPGGSWRERDAAQRHQTGAGRHSGHRRPEEGQLGSSSNDLATITAATITATTITTTITTTTATTSPPSLPPQHATRQASKSASFLPSLTDSRHHHPPQPFPYGREGDRSPDTRSPAPARSCWASRQSSAGSLHDPHSSQRLHSVDALSASSAECSPVLRRLHQPGFSPSASPSHRQLQQHPPPQGASFQGSERLAPSISTQPPGSSRHLTHNGHASAEQGPTGSEACCPQTLMKPWQSAPAHRKIKTLAQAEAEAQFNSSRNLGRTGVCHLS